jgi:predicted small metal-binding protein
LIRIEQFAWRRLVAFFRKALKAKPSKSAANINEKARSARLFHSNPTHNPRRNSPQKSATVIGAILRPTSAPIDFEKMCEVKEPNMPKVVNCKDAGVECDFVIRGETEQEILQQAADHARTAHNMSEIPPEVAQKLRGAIRDEAA